MKARDVEAEADLITGGNGDNGEGRDGFLISVLSVFSVFKSIHENFYQISMNYNFGTAARFFFAHLEPYPGKSSQVPLHEAFTHKSGFFGQTWSKPVKPKAKDLTGIPLQNFEVFPYKERDKCPSVFEFWCSIP